MTTLTEIHEIATGRRDADVTASSSLTKITDLAMRALRESEVPDPAWQDVVSIGIVAACPAPASSCMDVIAALSARAIREMSAERKREVS